MKFLLNKKNIFFTIMPYCFLFFFMSFCNGRQLRVLVIVPSFPKIHDVCMLNQITGLIMRGHDVTIYAEKRGDVTTLQDDVKKYDLLSRTIISPKLPRNLDRYDIVMFQLGHKAVNIKKTHRYKGKVVICLRGYDITGFLTNNEHAYDEFFKDCDLFMPVCESFKKILDDLGCPSSKITVHHSGIDCDKFSFNYHILPQDGTINVLSAGRYVEKKGFEYSIIAAAQLIRIYPRMRYTIIGDGVLKKKYQDIIKRLGMQNKITLVNWYDHEEYNRVLENSHIFVVPSITASNDDREGIPNVLKEAMAKGLFVIATDHSGNSEIIKNNISGFLVPERDSGAIVKAVTYICNNHKQLLSMQETARSLIVEDFDNEKVNDRLEEIFLRLVNFSV